MALITSMAAGPAQADPPDPSSFTVTELTPSGEPIGAPKSLSGQLAQSDPDLLNSTDSATTTVMVKLDYDAAASYTGGVDGLAPTSPSVTGKPLSETDPAVAGYLGYADGVNNQAASAIAAAVPDAKVIDDYSMAYGGLSVTLPANQAKTLLAVPGVAAVQKDALRQPDRAAVGQSSATPPAGLANDTASFIGADKVWPALGGPDRAGSGVVVGVLDTGIWPEHPMLADKGPTAPGGIRACDFGDGGNGALGPAFTCNNKLIVPTRSPPATSLPADRCPTAPSATGPPRSARRATPTVTYPHRDHRGRRPGGQRRRARHRSRADQRHCTGCVGHRLPGLLHRRLL